MLVAAREQPNWRLTDNEKIELYESQIEEFKNALKNKNSWAYQVYESNSPKKDFLRKWAECLEKLHYLGVYTEPIDTISTHIRNELLGMGLDKAIDWAKKTLPYKYKNKARIHAPPLLSKELEQAKGTESPKIENKRILNAYYHSYRTISKVIKYLENNRFSSKVDPDTLDEYCTNAEQASKNIDAMWDKREKVLTDKQHLLIAAYVEYSKNYAFKEYMKTLIKTMTITPKQVGRIVSGRLTHVDPLYDPQNRAEAKIAGFWGYSECDECGSWRQDIRYNTDLNRDMLYCWACKSWFQIKREKLSPKSI